MLYVIGLEFKPKNYRRHGAVYIIRSKNWDQSAAGFVDYPQRSPFTFCVIHPGITAILLLAIVFAFIQSIIIALIIAVSLTLLLSSYGSMDNALRQKAILDAATEMDDRDRYDLRDALIKWFCLDQGENIW